MTKRKSTEGQQRASSPTHSVWVSANAGSGKTQVLVDRVIKLLLDSAEPSTILCITFTKAAAAEMSQRLFARLSSWTSLNDQALLAEISELGMPTNPTMLTRARRLFTLALETPGGLKIQTIHGFCERLLQLFPVEAGLAPGFSVIDEFQAQEIRDEAIGKLLLNQKPNPEVRKALDEAKVLIGQIVGFSELVIRFLKIISKNVAFRAGKLSRQDFEGALKILLRIDPTKTAQDLKNDILDIDQAKYGAFGQILQTYGTFRSQNTPRLLIEIGRKSDCVEELRELFLNGKLQPFKDMINQKAATAHPDAVSFLYEEQRRFHIAFRQYHTLLQIEASGAIFEIANVVRHDIEAQKQLSGLCDFDDLIDRAAALLTAKDATHWVLRKLDQGLNHILVDEAQDTSPGQWTIIRALADEFFVGQGREQKILRTMFVVGDRKQSIYSFQGADLQTFSQTREYLTSRLDQAGNKFAEENLGLSFRSTKEILEAVDLVFPVEDLSHMGIRGDAITESPHSSARSGVRGIVELWPLIVGEKRDREDGEAWEAPVDQLGETHPRRLLAQKIAATLKNWIGRRNLSGESRPIAAGDILVLLQKRTGLFPLLLAEMRRVGLPVAGADRLTLQKSLAVQDLMSIIQWCLLPEDDYSLACILKSPIVPQAVSEEELFALAYDRGSSSLWEVARQTSSPNVPLLAEFQAKAMSTPVAEFLHQILNLARKRIVARLGSEALEATDALLDLAYDFESKHGGGLSAFLNWFEKSETTLKREMDQASDQIRVMSVHAAKGLEANIVILPDAADSAPGSQQARLLETGEDSQFPSLPFWNLGGLASIDELACWIEDERKEKQEERNRLLYVAMTRARNELYITGSTGNKSVPENSWWKRLESSLGPDFVKEPSLNETGDVSPDAVSSGVSATLPSWVFEPVAAINLNSAPFRIKDAALNTEAARHGAALHLMMQSLSDIDPKTRRRSAFQLGANLNLMSKDVENLLALFDRPDLVEFWSAEGRSEVEIWSSEAKSQTQTYRIDRLVLGSTETLILDFKSGTSPKFPLAADHPYLIQMAQYYRAIKAVRPEIPVRCAILWLESGKLDWFSESLLSQSPAHTATPNVKDAS